MRRAAAQVRRMPTGKSLPCGGQNLVNGGDSQSGEGLGNRAEEPAQCMVIATRNSVICGAYLLTRTNLGGPPDVSTRTDACNSFGVNSSSSSGTLKIASCCPSRAFKKTCGR